MIYKECFRFIKLSNNIKTIYSPSQEENVFLLVLLYKRMQWHYEVKMVNNEEKNIYNNKMLINNSNYWLIIKCKYELNKPAFKVPYDFDIKVEINNGIISTMGDYLNKKTKNNNITDNKDNKKDIQENNVNININDGIYNDNSNNINNNERNLTNKEAKNNELN